MTDDAGRRHQNRFIVAPELGRGRTRNGQRVRKTNTSTDTVFHYDTRGKLIAESDPGGTVKRELIYLGDIPVGVIQ